MSEPAVVLSFTTNGAGADARARAVRNIVAIALRPTLARADLGMLHTSPDVPRPGSHRGLVVRRTKPSAPRNTIRARFLTESARELFERLGEAERRNVGGSVIFRWDQGEGDGIVVARKSSAEMKSGETIGGQLDSMLKYCDNAGLQPRIVIAVLNVSGRTHFDSRHDFTEVFESFRLGQATWVLYRGMDRVARS